MKAGRELDALIAEKVMGGHRDKVHRVTNVDIYNKDITIGPDLVIPHYSTDIAAAWKVVEKIASEDRGEPNVLEIYGPLSDGYKVTAIWEHHDGAIPLDGIIAKTAPLGICLMALKLLDVNKSSP